MTHRERTAPIKSERLEATLAAALGGGPVEPLFEALTRMGGVPGPRPNIELSRAVAERLAGHPVGEEIAAALLAHKHLFLHRVGVATLAAQAMRPKRLGAFLTPLHDMADESDGERRDLVTDALSWLVEVRGDDVIVGMHAFTDGFLHAAVAIEAATRHDALSRLSGPDEIFARFAEAFDLADAAPRSADRAQGVRFLRRSFPRALARLANRFEREVLAFVTERMDRERPETREILTETISALRPIIGDPEAARLREGLGATEPPPRDPARIVHGTRNRSRGRR